MNLIETVTNSQRKDAKVEWDQTREHGRHVCMFDDKHEQERVTLQDCLT